MRTLPCLLALFALWTTGRPARAAIEEQHLAAPPTQAAPRLTQAPVLLQAVEPVYPAARVRAGAAGEATLWVDLDDSGAVERVEVASATHPAFGSAALEAVCAFRFAPAAIDGVPAGLRIEYRVHFAAPQAPAPAASTEPPVLLSGRVREAGSRAPIAHAAIALDGNIVTGTDFDGQFALRALPAGPLQIAITHPDYEPYQINEERGADERLEAKYYLVRRQQSAYETVVRSRADRHEVSKIELSREELRKVPGTFGDPIRVLENLPGMGRAPVLGGQLLVRGANPQDTQVMVDGMPIPLLYHLYGLTSVINAEFLERIDFYPGGFGARYGRATAGVVDIVSRDLDCTLWHGSAKLDVIDASAYTCVPLGTWRVAAAGRRSVIDAVLPLVLQQVESPTGQGFITVSPSYWDYQAQARTLLATHAIRLGAYGSYDTLKVIQTGSLANIPLNLGIKQGFHRLLLRDKWRLGEDTSLTSTVSPGYESQIFDAQASDAGVNDNLSVQVWNLAWREDFTSKLLPNLTLNAGLDHRFSWPAVKFKIPAQSALAGFPTPVFDFSQSQSYNQSFNQILQAYWAEIIWDPIAPLRLVPGVRLEHMKFGSTQQFLALPRAAVRWQVVPGSTLKAAYGLYGRLPDAQYLLPNFGNPALVSERSQQFVVGYEQEFPQWINLDVQAFYNLRSNLTSPSKSVTIANGQVHPELWNNGGSGRTYGLEIMLRRMPTSSTAFYGWVAYTLSRSLRRDQPLGSSYSQLGVRTPYTAYDTQEYLSQYDQTHILTIVAQWTLPLGFEAGMRFRLVSGNPTTPVRSGAIFWDSDVDGYTDDLSHVARNADRLPTFHQLDVRVDKTFTYDLWKLTVYLEVINAYYAKNIETYSYDYRFAGRVGVTLLPIIPNLGVKGEF